MHSLFILGLFDNFWFICVDFIISHLWLSCSCHLICCGPCECGFWSCRGTCPTSSPWLASFHAALLWSWAPLHCPSRTLCPGQMFYSRHRCHLLTLLMYRRSFYYCHFSFCQVNSGLWSRWHLFAEQSWKLGHFCWIWDDSTLILS